jgi:hypothetical protein
MRGGLRAVGKMSRAIARYGRRTAQSRPCLPAAPARRVKLEARQLASRSIPQTRPGCDRRRHICGCNSLLFERPSPFAQRQGLMSSCFCGLDWPRPALFSASHHSASRCPASQSTKAVQDDVPDTLDRKHAAFLTLLETD